MTVNGDSIVLMCTVSDWKISILLISDHVMFLFIHDLPDDLDLVVLLRSLNPSAWQIFWKIKCKFFFNMNRGKPVKFIQKCCESTDGATDFVRLNSASRPLTMVTEPSPAPTRKSPVLSLHSAVTPLLKFSLGPFTCKYTRKNKCGPEFEF